MRTFVVIVVLDVRLPTMCRSVPVPSFDQGSHRLVGISRMQPLVRLV